MSEEVEVIQSVDQLKCGDHISFPTQFCGGTCTHHALVVADNIGHDMIKIIHVAEKNVGQQWKKNSKFVRMKYTSLNA